MLEININSYSAYFPRCFKDMRTTVLDGVCLTFVATLIYKKNAFFQNKPKTSLELDFTDKNKPKGQETSLELKLNL